MKLQFFILIIFSGLIGCVEIKDPEHPEVVTELEEPNVTSIPQPAPTPQVIVAKKKIFTVDQPLYLWEGEILDAQQIKKKDISQKSPKLHVYKFEVLDIRTQGILYTLGNDVKIEVEEFISDGTIQTFPEGVTARVGQKGQSGGLVDLRLKDARGYLKAVLRGEKGGKGPDGAAPDEALRGEQGRSYTCQQFHQGQFDLYEAQGKQGKRGYPGSDGLSGGDSGRMNIYYPQDANFVVKIEKYPGEGGEKGAGGAGGHRGPRGDLCLIPSQDHLRPAHILQGPTGYDGNKGPSGQPSPVCIWQGGQQQCL